MNIITKNNETLENINLKLTLFLEFITKHSFVIILAFICAIALFAPDCFADMATKGEAGIKKGVDKTTALVMGPFMKGLVTAIGGGAIFYSLATGLKLAPLGGGAALIAWAHGINDYITTVF